MPWFWGQLRVWISYGSQNKQLLCSLTALTDWSLKWRGFMCRLLETEFYTATAWINLVFDVLVNLR